MVQSKKVIVDSVINNFKVLYAAGIGAHLFIALILIAYAVVAYDMLTKKKLCFPLTYDNKN